MGIWANGLSSLWRLQGYLADEMAPRAARDKPRPKASSPRGPDLLVETASALGSVLGPSGSLIIAHPSSMPLTYYPHGVVAGRPAGRPQDACLHACIHANIHIPIATSLLLLTCSHFVLIHLPRRDCWLSRSLAAPRTLRRESQQYHQLARLSPNACHLTVSYPHPSLAALYSPLGPR